jgi:glycosyltransferase involved in cell wall biosynthesis
LVSDLHLKKRIVFYGPVERDKIPSLLMEAFILCLARPKSVQAQGGFPTKLGEYLITGNPVVVTKVGEIPKYLKDNESAFLAEPGDVSSFSDKLEYVINNYEEALKVGKKGKEVALKNFNYLVQAKKMIEYFRNFYTNKAETSPIN